MMTFNQRRVLDFVIASCLVFVTAQPAAAERSELQHRAIKIFRQLLNVADIPRQVRPQLVIAGFNKDSPRVDAQGRVTLPPAILDKCYEQGEVMGDARVAFILAHELAHISRRHHSGDVQFAFMKERFERQDYPQALQMARQQSYPDLERLFQELLDLQDEKRIAGKRAEIDLRIAEIRKAKELDADRYGIFYLMAAGYDPQMVLDRNGGFVKEINLFLSGPEREVVDERNNRSFHPVAETRQEKLQAYVMPIIQRFKLFMIAKRYYQMGDYRGSREILEELITSPRDPALVFYSKEIFNNLGLAIFQQAIASDRCRREAHRWYLPGILETELPQAAGRGERVSNRPCQEDNNFKENIGAAIDAYKQALDLDPGYEVAQLNLSTALIVQEEYEAARTEVRKLLIAKPGDLSATNLHAIITFCFDAERQAEAVQSLQALLKENPGHAATLFNLARMLTLQERSSGQAAAAVELWQQFIQAVPDSAYLRYLPATVVIPARKVTAATAVPLPEIKPGAGIGTVRSKATGRINYDFAAEAGPMSLRLLGNEDTVWVFDWEELLFVEKKVQTGESADAWRKRFGPPLRTISQRDGSIFLYNGFGFEERAGVVHAQFWFVTPPEV